MGLGETLGLGALEPGDPRGFRGSGGLESEGFLKLGDLGGWETQELEGLGALGGWGPSGASGTLGSGGFLELGVSGAWGGVFSPPIIEGHLLLKPLLALISDSQQVLKHH